MVIKSYFSTPGKFCLLLILTLIEPGFPFFWDFFSQLYAAFLKMLAFLVIIDTCSATQWQENSWNIQKGESKSLQDLPVVTTLQGATSHNLQREKCLSKKGGGSLILDSH